MDATTRVPPSGRRSIVSAPTEQLGPLAQVGEALMLRSIGLHGVKAYPVVFDRETHTRNITSEPDRDVGRARMSAHIAQRLAGHAQELRRGIVIERGGGFRVDVGLDGDDGRETQLLGQSLKAAGEIGRGHEARPKAQDEMADVDDGRLQ